MESGDFVAVHFYEPEIGTQIGRFVSDDGETVSVELGIIGGELIVMYNIPKQLVTPLDAVN